MKKLLVFLLALVIMTGSLSPCHADDGCHSENCQSDSKEEENDWGSCSPFFTCDSCVGFLQSARYSAVEPPAELVAEYWDKKVLHCYPGFIASFLKPPQSRKLN